MESDEGRSDARARKRRKRNGQDKNPVGRPRKRMRGMDGSQRKNPVGRPRKRVDAIEGDVGVKLRVLVGRYVRKEFAGYGVFLGKVVSYSEGFYRLEYEDGDNEDLESEEVLEILIEESGFNAELRRRRKKLDELVAKNAKKSGSGSERPRGKEGASVGKCVDGGEVDCGSKLSSEDAVECVPEKSGELDGDVEKVLPSGDDDDDDSSSDSCEFDRVREDSLAEEPVVPPPLFPASSGSIGVPEDAVPYLLSVYSFLRSFSIQLFLSPFQLEDFVGSLNCTTPNSLMDGIHFALLRALRRHLEMSSSDGSSAASKCLRRLDWSLLDTLTWPVYLVEYLLVMGHAEGPDWKGFYSDALGGVYHSLPVTRKLTILQILCDDVIESAELRAEIDTRENLEEEIDSNGTASLPPETGPRRVHPRYSKTSACKDVEAMASLTEPHNSKSSSNKSLASSATGCDVDATDVDQDVNSDECRLCGMDGTLLCCDGCPSAYHSRCIGMNKMLIPDGLWFCPECNANQMEPTLRIATGLRGAEIFGIDSYENVFLGICSHLLVLNASINPTPLSKYYNQSDIPKVLQVLCSSLQHKTLYSGICKRIIQYWGIADTDVSLPDAIDGEINPVTDEKKYAVVADSRYNLSGETNEVEHAIEGDNHRHNAYESIVENEGLSGPQSVLPKAESKKTSLDTVDQDFHKITQINEGVDAAQVLSLVRNSKSCDQFGTKSVIYNGLMNHNNDWTQQMAEKRIGLECTAGKRFADGAPTLINNDTLIVKGKTKGSGRSKGDTNDASFFLGASFKPHSYINQYFLGDIAASAAANLYVVASEEKGVVEGPVSSNPRNLVSANTALQVKAFLKASVRFFWPISEKKLMEVPRERCGWCLSCRAPTSSRKGCLLNLAASNAIKASARILVGFRPVKTGDGSIQNITTYMLYMEESLRGLVVGPFLSESYRRQWRKQVEQASTFSSIKLLLFKFEKHIRSVAFSGGWLKQVDDWSIESSAVQNSSVGQIPKRPGRRSKKQAATSEMATDLCDDDAKIIDWWRGGKLLKLVFQRGMLPKTIAKRAARQGGSRKISGIHYVEASDIPHRSRQLAWRAAVEASKNASQLALQVRYLDVHVRWSDLVRPEQNAHEKGPETETSVFRNARICDKKVQENKIMYGLSFVNQKHLPSRVTKNIIEVEQTEDGKEKFWFSETHIPLFLIKEYEEKAEDTDLPAKPLHVLSKLQCRQIQASRRDIFRYLMNGRGKVACAVCQADVMIGDSVKCNECEGYCHKDCTVPSTADTKNILDALVTCNQCYQAKAIVIKENVNKAPMSRLIQQGQECKMAVGFNKDARNNGYHQPLPSIWKTETNSVMKSPLPGSNSTMKGKQRGVITNGIVWKKKRDVTGTDFRLKNILLSGNTNLDPCRGPRCCLCNKPYDSGLMYIHCESCQNWYHADAVELKESQIFDVIGFRCCKCRRKASPACPYMDQESRKSRIRASKQCRMEIEPQLGTIPKQSMGWETTPVSKAKMEDAIIEDDDPLLFSLEKVEIISEPTSEFGPDWDTSGASFNGPQKLPVRRHVKSEKGADGLMDLSCAESTPHETFPSQFESEWNKYESEWNIDGFNDETLDYDGVNCEGMEFEPQTYFSFTELLAPDDDQSNTFDASNNWENSLDSGLPPPSNLPEQYEMKNVNGELPVTVEPAIKIPCHVCSHDEPATDLSCERCAMCIHRYCSPWIEEPDSDCSWRCGYCREWR